MFNRVMLLYFSFKGRMAGTKDLQVVTIKVLGSSTLKIYHN